MRPSIDTATTVAAIITCEADTRRGSRSNRCGGGGGSALDDSKIGGTHRSGTWSGGCTRHRVAAWMAASTSTVERIVGWDVSNDTSQSAVHDVHTVDPVHRLWQLGSDDAQDRPHLAGQRVAGVLGAVTTCGRPRR